MGPGPERGVEADRVGHVLIDREAEALAGHPWDPFGTPVSPAFRENFTCVEIVGHARSPRGIGVELEGLRGTGVEAGAT